MVETSYPRATADHLLAEMRAAMADTDGQPPRIEEHDPGRVDRLAALLTSADQYAAVGSAMPSLASVRGVMRYPARLLARAVLSGSRFLTDRQAQLNVVVLHALRVLTDAVARLERGASARDRADTLGLDMLHAGLMEEFRGSRAAVGERLRVYLPIMREIEAGARALPVLDLGCGRGEWLELLREEGWPARGVDANRVFVDQCRARGLSVTRDEALAHLRGLPGASLAAVTAFHLAEHLPFEALVSLIDEIVRVLCPGGVMILETPDPANLRVAGFSFYCDPSHHHPLPSPLLKFVAAARGLHGVYVLPLHPSGSAATDGHQPAPPFSEHFDGPQDYAVVGRKA